MANANDLQKRVEVWKYDVSTNLGGTPVEPWQFYKYTYAGIRVDNGLTTNVDPEGDLPYTNVTITLRYDPLIDYNCQIRYGGQHYKINYIQDDGNNFYVLKCITYNEYK